MSSAAARRTVTLTAVAWVVALGAAAAVGSQPLDLGALLEGDPVALTLLWKLRVPRALLALLAGGALAAAGAGFQALFRNPLAEPYTLGVASGAALGAVLALQVAPHGWAFGAPLVYAASFLGALAVTALIVGLATARGGTSTATLLLAGIAISLSSSALILFVQYLADFHRTYRMVRWMMGGLAVVGFGEVLWAAPWVVLGVAVLVAHRRELDLLLTGEELAASRGVDLTRLRWIALAATSAMVGALVAVAGPIGFVGLVVPHVLRRWTGHDHALLLPACFLGGGAFLALCDLAARRLLAPAELPVGVLTALTGGPFFLWLLLRRRLG
ncbi:MAG: iron ABC transporter permease [Thermoanaerobaculia bacterium]|nr:iron ABC transporter permease [Thermoanaerobaculia bacterium]